MRQSLVRLSVACALAFPLALPGQARGFVVKLGTDTIAIERFEASGERIEGTLLRRSPRAYLLKYTVRLNPDGTVASYEQTVTLPDGSPMPNTPAGPLRITFTGDSVIRDIVRNNQPVTLRSAAPKGTLPTIGPALLGSELAIQAAKRGDGQVHTIGLNAQQAAPAQLNVRLIGSDSAEIVQQGFRTGFKLDQRGRVVRSDGSLTTQKFIATPDATVDLNAIAAAWAAKDAAGQAMGAASTRDTLNATLAGANIWIDYGRPAKRGRAIWGALVPFDTTWRLGANAATQFRTDKDLKLGGVSIPAGSYTLWLYPSANQSYLIVNTQTGQWGTQHDASKDLARIPLEPHMSLPTSEERFRIFVQGDMLMLHWDRGGYGVKITAK